VTNRSQQCGDRTAAMIDTGPKIMGEE